MRLTIEQTMSTQAGADYATQPIRKAVTDGPHLLWYVIPRTGGSSWQHINRVHVQRTNKVEAM